MNFLRDLASIGQTIEAATEHPTSTPYIDWYVLVLEDRRFFNHPGFDPISISRALFSRLLFGFPGGASTIEQQLVRTITGHKERTVSRKIREIALSISVAKRFPKRTILSAYLRIAYMGHSLRGIEEASRALFRKPPEELSPDESATIASLLLYPAPSRPNATWLRKVERRRRHAVRFDSQPNQRRQLVRSLQASINVAQL